MQLLNAGSIEPGQHRDAPLRARRLRAGVRGARRGRRPARQGDARDHQPPIQPLSRPSGSLWAASPGQRAQEVEVAALVGLQHVLEVERAVAAPRSAARRGAALGEAALDLARPGRRGRGGAPRRRGRSGRRRAPRASGPPAADSGATCRTTVPNAVPLMRASRDPHHVGHAAREQLLRDRQLAPLRHARAAARARVAQHEHRVGASTSRPGSSIRAGDVVDVLEDERRAAVAQQLGRGGAALDHRAARGEGAAQDAEPALGLSGLVERSRSRRGRAPRRRRALAERLAGDGQRVAVRAAARARCSTACTPPARCRCSKRCSPDGRTLREHRRAPRELVEAVERERHAERARPARAGG